MGNASVYSILHETLIAAGVTVVYGNLLVRSVLSRGEGRVTTVKLFSPSAPWFLKLRMIVNNQLRSGCLVYLVVAARS